MRLCKEEVCFNCNIRENCDHVSNLYFFDCNCKAAAIREYNSRSIAEIAYAKLFDNFRRKL